MMKDEWQNEKREKEGKYVTIVRLMSLGRSPNSICAKSRVLDDIEFAERSRAHHLSPFPKIVS